MLLVAFLACSSANETPKQPQQEPSQVELSQQERAQPTPVPPTEPEISEPSEVEAPRAARAPPGPVRTTAVSDAIAQLPVIARLDKIAPTTFVLRGRLSKRRARAMERLARSIIGDVATRFVGPVAPTSSASTAKAGRSAVDVCLFETDEDYAAFSAQTGDRDTMLGFYLPRQRLVVANLGRSVGNLRHELIHPLVGDDFAKRRAHLPAWFNEGLGSLYGSARVNPRGVRFLVNYRLRSVLSAKRAGQLPSLSEIAGSGRPQLYGPRSGTFYGTARYLLLYLDASGTLDEFYRELAVSNGTETEQRRLLEKHVDYTKFVAWLSKLRNGSLAPRPR